VGLERLQERILVEQVGDHELDVVADRIEVRVVGAFVPDGAEDLVAAVEEQLGQERAVLATDPRNQRPASHCGSLRFDPCRWMS